MSSNFLNEIKWNEQGLICAIAQEAKTQRVLMVAWMNEEALNLSVQTKEAHYFSRSRNKLWKKGEESGHNQKIVEIRLDCDGDVILIQIEQTGLACHTGRTSCFYRKFSDSQWLITDDIIKSENDIYHR